MKAIAVIGGGAMGLDIAQVFARNGFSVVLRELNDTLAATAQSRLEKSLFRLVEKGKLEKAVRDAITQSIRFTADLSAVAEAALVVEAIVERLEVKRELFSQLDQICREGTIFASNTSSISITAIASATKRSDRFIGMHFFNPATTMKLVEVIRGVNTSEETCSTIYKLCLTLKKEPVEIFEAPGFVVNKILVPMINEAACLLETGVSSAEDIDKAMRLGANHPMGPLTLGDFVGLDIVLAVMETLYGETGDPKYRASLLLRKLVRAGHLGRKSGAGFYNYGV